MNKINLWIPKIISKLKAENATNLSDKEIYRCLSGCVAGRRLVDYTRYAIDKGLITQCDLSQNNNNEVLEKWSKK